MAEIQTGKSPIDYYTINSDWAGNRIVTNTLETVQYHNNSSIRIWCNTQQEEYAPHWHTALEIIMPIENYYEVEANQELYHILPGEALVIPPGEMHRLIAPKTGQRLIFLFNISHITKLKGFSGIHSLLMQPIYLTKEAYPKIYGDVFRILSEIQNEYFRRNEYAELAIHALLLNFFITLGYNHIREKELFPNVHLPKQKEYVKKFNDLLDYIDTHYDENLSLESTASVIGFSKFHFSRLFKQYTNLTFNDYLNRRRLKAAEELLANPSLSINEVSLQSGYASLSTFNRLFKQMKHCTPSEYRSKNSTVL